MLQPLDIHSQNFVGIGISVKVLRLSDTSVIAPSTLLIQYDETYTSDAPPRTVRIRRGFLSAFCLMPYTGFRG